MAAEEIGCATTLPDADGALHQMTRALQAGAARSWALRLVESPARALVRAAATANESVDAAFDVEVLLSDWCASARRLVREVQARPGHLTLLDADEVAAAPHQALSMCPRIAPNSPTDRDVTAGVEGLVEATGGRAASLEDALALAAATSAVADHAEATRLWCELHGSCQPLQVEDAPATTAGGPAGALHAWRQMRSLAAGLQQELHACRSSLAAAESQLAELNASAHTLREDASLGDLLQRQALDELATLAVAANQARAESSNLRAALAGEREARLHDGRRFADLQLRVDELQAQLSRRDAELSQRTGSLQLVLDATTEALETERARSEQERQQREPELDALRRERARSSVQIDRLRQDSEVRTQQWEHTHAELLERISGLTSSLTLAQQEREEALDGRRQFEADTAGRLDELQQICMNSETALLGLRAELDATATELGEARLHSTEWQQRAGAWQESSQRLEQAAQTAEDQVSLFAFQAKAAEQALASLNELRVQDHGSMQRLQVQVAEATEEATRSAAAAQAAEEALAALRELRAQDHGSIQQLQTQVAEITERATRSAAAAQTTEEALAALRRQQMQDQRARQLMQAQLGDALAGLASANGSIADSDEDPMCRLRSLIRLGHVEQSAEQRQPPHRELSLTIRLPQDGVADLPALSFELRLVEHEGRPGFVWLARPGEPPPLHAWRATGREDTREYVRLIPSDIDDAAVLARLPSADWRLLLAMAQVLPDVLMSHLDGDASNWVVLARRLALQLRAMAPRLRYSALEAERPNLGSRAELLFRDVMFGDESMADIQLSVDPQPNATTSLVWHLPASGVPALASWPTDEAGRPISDWTLAIGHAPMVASKRRWWAERPARDQAVLFGLLDALPAAAEPLSSAGPEGTLRQSAEQWHREARRLVQRQGLRTRLRRLQQLVGLGYSGPAAQRE